MPELLSLCPYATCNVPDGTCRRGEPSPETCPEWHKRGETAAPVDTSGVRDYVRWNGAGLGSRDVSGVAVRSPTNLVGVVGPHDAGKTSLLSSMWLHMQRGYTPSGRRFAGSVTLGGWEDRAHFLRWWPSGSASSFPPHTSVGIKRESSLLHMTLRGPSGLREVLVTDAPGEWFTRWAAHADSNAADGARWIDERASGFLFVLDSEALAGLSKTPLGKARRQALDLISRMSASIAGRPVAVVWSKADLVDRISEEVRSRIEEDIKRAFNGPLAAFNVSIVRPSDAAMTAPPDVLAWVLDAAKRPVAPREPEAPSGGTVDPLLSFRYPGHP